MLKRPAPLALGVLMIVVLSCQTTAVDSPSAAKAHPLLGSWEMTSGRWTFPDGSVRTADSTQLRSLKVVGPARFVFITSRPDGEFVRSAGGRYTISGNTYSEHVDHSSSADMRNETYTFTWRVDGDTWYHTGEHEGTRLEEVWRRAR